MHLATGRWMMENKQVPRVDLYSYTRPDHPWRAHEWLTQLTMFALLGKVGYTGLAGIFAVLVVCALEVARRQTSIVLGNENNHKAWDFGLLFLAGMVIFPYVGIRPQVVNWLFLAIELYLVRKVLSVSNPFKWVAPLVGLIVLWSNLHGGWLLGILLIAAIACVEIAKRKFRFEINQNLGSLALIVAIVLSVVGVQILNPYGLNVVSETWLTMTDTDLRWKINEWMPMSRGDIAFVFYVGLVLVLTWRFKGILDRWELWGSWGFILASFSSNRHIPLFVIFSLPIVFKSKSILFRKIDNQGTKPRLKVAVTWFIVLVLIATGFQIWGPYKLTKAISEEKFYPWKAMDYLGGLNSESKVFNYYGWGGYLIWNLPGRRWFIDGRMPSWDNVLDEYQEVGKGTEEGQLVLDKYDVDYVLWPTDEIDLLDAGVWRLIENAFGLSREKDKGVIGLVESLNWELVYKDKVAQIWRSRR